MANEAIRRSIEIHNKGSVSTNVSPKEKYECAGCVAWERKFALERTSHEKCIKALKDIEERSRNAIKETEVKG